MANWLIYCAQNYLMAIYSLLITFLLKENVLHADETTVQVLHEPGRAPQTKSYEWLYRTSGCSEHPIVIYEYQETRKQDYPKAFLKDFNGYLHTDGYQAYHNLPSGITVVGCWFHARSYWENLYKTIPADKRDGSNAEPRSKNRMPNPKSASTPMTKGRCIWRCSSFVRSFAGKSLPEFSRRLKLQSVNDARRGIAKESRVPPLGCMEFLDALPNLITADPDALFPWGSSLLALDHSCV
jgi:diadenosine tetraphosphatase ApaH/serine/threonine PP2A family protein phosphatase